MKNLFITAILCMLFANRSDAQITLQHSYYGYAYVAELSSNGEKIYTYDTAAVYLYNMDYTLWRTIVVPTHAGYKLSGVYAVSDNLFNSDNLVEFVATYVAKTYPLFPTYQSEVINESGTVVQVLDTSLNAEVHYDQVDNNYKLFTHVFTTAAPAHYSTNIFSLPGTMPCGHCGSLGTERVAGSNQTIFISDPTPNPSSGIVRINYSMPSGYSTGMIQFFNSVGQLVKQTPVFAQPDFIEINNSTLPAGTYLYNLKADNLVSETKTMVIK